MAVSARLVEAVIAASIAWVAVENLRTPAGPSRRWLVSFGFGLVHGFGLASALQPLALPPWHLALALLGFNLGVEAGQTVVILALTPGLVWLRRLSWQPQLMRGASAALALIGLLWCVQRLYGP
jgi:hypothetical protein